MQLLVLGNTISCSWVHQNYVQTLPLCSQPLRYWLDGYFRSPPPSELLSHSPTSLASGLTNSKMSRYTKPFPWPWTSSSGLLCKAPVPRIHVRSSLLQFQMSLIRISFPLCLSSNQPFCPCLISCCSEPPIEVRLSGTLDLKFLGGKENF